MKQLAIIIPCNDSLETVAAFLPGILRAVNDKSRVEVVFVDAFERNEIRQYVENLNCKYAFVNLARRSKQCNVGASVAGAPYLFFLHIDSIPPPNFDVLIMEAFRQKAESGCFRLKFDGMSRFLSAFAWFTQFKWSIARGGDQGLFVSRSCFMEIGKYNDSLQIMEDIAICRKLLERNTFKILSPALITSARKYKRVGTVKLQSLFIVITMGYWLGFSNENLSKFYTKHIA